MRHVFVVAALLAADPAFSQVPVQPQITVTATRRAQTVDDTLASVSVITRADIERSQAPDLPALLRGLPGIDVARTGGDGQSTSVFVRGTNSNQTLILIDGIRVASANSGAYAFENLPLALIERIEIVRGPRAGWYGSDAIGGVIQIFTRDPRATSAQISLGRWQRYQGSASIGVGDADSGLGLTLGGLSVDGFSAQTPDGFAFDPDRDGNLNRSLGLRARHMAGQWRMQGHALATRADVEFDQGRSSANQHSLGVAADGPLGTAMTQRIAIGSSREALATPDFFSAFETRREMLDWNASLDLAAQHRAILGVNWMRERGASINTFDGSALYRQGRRNLGLFVGGQGSGERSDYEWVARRDDNSVLGSTNTWQLAGGWRASDSWRGFGSYGLGFRAPNLNELFSPGFGGLFAGNPALDPERSASAELGADWSGSGQRAQLRIFRTRVRDLIAFQGGQTFQAVNVARAAIDGAELSWELRHGHWLHNANATWQDARDDDSGLQLFRRPQRKLSTGVEYGFDGGGILGGELQYVSARRDFAAQLRPYALASIRAELPLDAQWRLGARVDNLTGRDHPQAAGFSSAGRALLLTVRYQAD